MKQTEGKLQQYLMYAGLVLAVMLMAAQSEGWIGGTGSVKEAASRKAVLHLQFPLLGGGTWRLEDHRGEVVLINFWASWCPPCRIETPGLVKLATAYRPKGLAVLGVSMDDSGAGEIKAFVNEYHLPYPIALPDAASPLVSAVESLPTTILIDRSGRVAKTYMGAVRESVFQADVDRLLAESRDPQQQGAL